MFRRHRATDLSSARLLNVDPLNKESNDQSAAFVTAAPRRIALSPQRFRLLALLTTSVFIVSSLPLKPLAALAAQDVNAALSSKIVKANDVRALFVSEMLTVERQHQPLATPDDVRLARRLSLSKNEFTLVASRVLAKTILSTNLRFGGAVRAEIRNISSEFTPSEIAVILSRALNRYGSADTAHAQISATSAPSVVADQSLTQQQLDGAVAQAEADWHNVDANADFSSVTFQIADLADPEFGHEDGNVVTIDPTAAGFGWSAVYPDDASQRIDLLTVVRHELGHVLGMSHTDSGLMSPTLAPGEVRDVPAASAPASAAPTGSPVLGISPSSLDLGSIEVGSSGPGKLFITNSGDADLIIDSATVPTGGAFSVSGVSFPLTIAPGQTASVDVVFRPTTEGSVSDVLTIQTNAGGPATVPLSGTGVAAHLTGAPSSLDFGTQNVSSPASQGITIGNSGTTVLNISSVSVTGDAASFLTNATIPMSLAPGQTATIQITAVPGIAGAHLAQLIIQSNNQAGAVSVPLAVVGTHWLADSSGSRTAVLAPGAAWNTVLSFGSGKASLAEAGASDAISLSGVSNLRLIGGNLNDFLSFVAGGTLPVAVSFDGGNGVDTLSGPTIDSTWNVTGPGSGSVLGLTFTHIENLVGASGNRDNFVVAPGATISGVIDGGPGGFDTLAVAGTKVIASPISADSGWLVIDSHPLFYSGLEPVDISAASVVMNGEDSAFVLKKDLLRVTACTGGDCPTGNIKIVDRDPTDSFDLAELHYFAISGLNDLTINGGAAADTVEFASDYIVPSTNLTVNAEKIILKSGVTINVNPTSGGCALGLCNVTFNAVAKDDGTTVTGITSTLLGVEGSIDLDSASILGNTIQLLATAGTDSGITNTGSSSGVTHSGLQLIYSALVNLHGASSIVATGDVTLASVIAIVASATAAETSNSDDSKDASVVATNLISTAKSQLSGTSSISAPGKAILITALTTSSILSNGDGSGAGKGAGIAVAVIISDTEAFIDSTNATPITAGSLTLNSDTDQTVTTTAKASAGGSSANDDTANNRTKKPAASDGNAKTADGDVNLAGALAFTYISDTAKSYIAPTSGTPSIITTGGQQKLHAGSKRKVSTGADGSSTVSNSSSAVGVAVAVGVADFTTAAFIDKAVNLTLNKLVLEAVDPSTNSFTVTSTSGIGDASSVGVAGSLAVSVLTSNTVASLKPTAVIVLLGGGLKDVSLTATSLLSETDKALSVKDPGGGGSVGIGASVAINVVNDTAGATLDDGSSLTGARDLLLTAASTDAMTTDAENGASGGTFVFVPVPAISISNVTTLATIGTGSLLTLTGKLDANATQDASVISTAKGDAAGSTAAVGAALALTIANHKVFASTARSITAAGLISFVVNGASTATSDAKASASGAKGDGGSGDGSGKDVNGKGNDQRGAGDAAANRNGAQDSSSSSSNPNSSSGDGAVSVAAAIAINVLHSQSKAFANPGLTLISGGLIRFKSTANTDGFTNADGSATGNKDPPTTVNIGAAVAVNKVDIENIASTGNSTLSSTGLTVEALMRDTGKDPVQIFKDGEWKSIDEGASFPESPEDEDLFHLTEGAPASTKVDGASQSVGGGSLTVKNANAFPSAGTFTGSGIDGTCTYTGKTATSITGITGCTGTPEDKATITSTTGTTVSGGGQVVGGTLNVADTTNFASSGKFKADGIDGTCLYSGKTATSFTGITGCTGTPDDGAAVLRIHFLPGVYKWNDGTSTWDVQSTGPFAHGTTFPGSPSNGDFFILAEHHAVANAKSGADGDSGKVSVAGALALNIISNHTKALVPSAANVTAGTGDISIKTLNNAEDVAKADSDAKSGKVGVGASVSLNVLDDHITRSAIEDGAGFTGGGKLDILADSRHIVTTEDKAGSKGGVSISPSVAIAIVKDQTSSYLGTGAASAITGAATIKSTEESLSELDSNAEAGGSDVAIGAAIAINVVQIETHADLARNLTAASLAIGSTTVTDAESTSHASAKGESEDGSGKNGGGESNADEQSKDQVNNNPNTNGKTGGSLPKGKDSTDQGTSESSSDSGDSSGGVGIAASLALNWTRVNNTSSIGNGAHVTTTGPVSVSSSSLTKAVAKALAASSDLSSSVSIAAGVGINVQDITNTASISGQVTGTAITVEAITPNGKRNDFIVWGIAGAAGKSDASIAASVGIQVLTLHTTAFVDKGSLLTSTGPITVQAKTPMGMQNLAISGALSTSGTAVGGAVTVSILPAVQTQAYIDSSVASPTIVKAAGAIIVKATSSLDPISPDSFMGIDFPAISSVAVGLDASGGSAAVTGSIIVDVFAISTYAFIGDGVRVNQVTVGGAGQTIEVTATHATTLKNIAGSVSLTTGSAGVGLGLIVEVINTDVKAYIGKSGVLSSGGDVTIHAISTQDLLEIAMDAAAASTAGVEGSIIVVVLNKGGGSPGTRAYIDGGAGQGTSLHSGGNIDILATNIDLSAGHSADSLVLLAGGLAFGSTAGVSVASSTLIRDATFKAFVGRDADVQARGSSGLSIASTQSNDLKLFAIGGGGGGTVGVAGSVVVDLLGDTTYSYIDRGAAVNGSLVGASSTAGIAVKAQDSTKVLSIAGAVAIGGSAGVGAGVDVEVITKDTQAWIGKTANINGNGDVLVDAISKENVVSIAMAASVGGSAAVSINAGVSVYNISTDAYIDGGLPSEAAFVSTGGTVRVSSDETLKLDVVAGNLSVGGAAGVGAAASVPVIKKETHSWVGDNSTVIGKGGGSGATVNSGSYSVSLIDPRFDPAGGAIVDGSTLDLGYEHGFTDGQKVIYDAGGGTPITGLTSGGVYFVKLVTGQPTRAQLRNTATGPVINTFAGGGGENHRLVSMNSAGVNDDKNPRFNPRKAGAVSGTTMTLAYNHGILNDDDTVVYSSGGGTPIGGLVDGQTYYAKVSGLGPNQVQLRATKGGAAIPLDASQSSGKSHSVVKQGAMPSADAAATGPRTISAAADTGFKGVAITATNSDDIATVAVSMAIGLSAGVAITGSIDIFTANTSAYVGKSARINCAPITCANSGAGTSQSVLVAAANQFYGLEVAASAAGGVAGIGPGVSVGIITLNTDAFIDDSAKVKAAKDVTVRATGKDEIVDVTVSVAGGIVGVGGAVAVNVLNTHAYANTGTGVTIDAGNNVLMTSSDDTKAIVVAGAIAGGFVGVGLSVGVTSITKDTRAFLGSNNIVDAKSASTGIDGIFTGEFAGKAFQTGTAFHGLGIQASSSEDIFGLVIAGGGGFVGVGGAVGVSLIHVTTKAYVGGGSDVNGQSADNSQSVNISAVDFIKTLTIGGGVAGGFVGVGAGVDIGVAQTSTQAFIDPGATVRANNSVDLNALARKQIQTYAIAVAGGVVGAAGSISVWTIGTQPTSNYNDGVGGPDKGDWAAGTTYNKGDTVSYCTNPADSTTCKRYGSKLDGNMGNTPSSSPTQWTQDVNALGHESGGGNAADDADSQVTGGSGGYQSLLNGSSSGSGDKTDSRVRDVTGASSSSGIKKNIKDNGDSLAGLTSATLASSAVPDGTSAAMNGAVIAGGNVGVRARELLDVNGLTGTAAAGIVAIGGSILIVGIGEKVDAGVGGGGRITAGGLVLVSARMTENTDGLAFAGQAGLVSLGAQVVVVNDSASTNSHIDNNAKVRKALLGLTVEAITNRTIKTNALGVSIGLATLGAAVAVSTVSGDTLATIGNVGLAEAGDVAGVTVNADSTINAQTKAISLQVGLIALGAAVPFDKVTGLTKASFGGHGPIAGNLSVTGTGIHSVTANSLNIQGALIGVGVTVANAVNGRSTEALVTSSTDSAVTGSVSVKAESADTATANTPGATFGAVNIAVLIPMAEVSGHTKANINGKITSSTFTTVQAIGNKDAQATATVASVSIGSVNGAAAIANVTSGAFTEAGIGSSGEVSSVGLVKVEAKLKGTNNNALASVLSAAAGVITVGATFASAQVNSAVRARMDGKIKSSNSVDILATSVNTANSTLNTFGLALGVGVAIAGAEALIGSSATTEVIGTPTPSITSDGAIKMWAKSTNTATATSDTITGGLLAGFNISEPDATISAPTNAQYDGAVTKGTSFDLEAFSTNTSSATENGIAGSIGISANGGAADALIDSNAATSSSIGSGGNINGLSQKLTVKSTSANKATAKASGKSIALLGGLAFVDPTATDNAPTSAALSGSVGTTHLDPVLGTVGDPGAFDIEVSAFADDRTVASVESLTVGILAFGASSAKATTNPNVSASLGSGNVTATNNIDVLSNSLTDADAFAKSTSAGLIEIQAALDADAKNTPSSSATVGGGFVQAGNRLTISANHGQAPAPLSDGTITSVDQGNNILGFALPHGLSTGDTVVYSAPSYPNATSPDPNVQNGSIPNPYRIVGLNDGQTYGVIVGCSGTPASCMTLKLGVEFDAGGAFDAATASIMFSQPHNLKTGDQIIYDCNGGSAFVTKPAGGLTCGGTYTVFKVDGNRIRLRSGAPLSTYNFTPTLIAGSVITVPSTAGLADGQARVYHQPATIEFKSSLVDVQVDGSGKIVFGSTGIDHSVNTNKIFAPSHASIGFTNGVEVIYTATKDVGSPTVLNPLTNGGHYFIHVDGTDPNRIQLSSTYCAAVGGVADPTNCTNNNGTPSDSSDDFPIAISVISLNPDFSVPALKTDHHLQRAGWGPIGGLVNGDMYFIDVISGTQFQLLDSSGNPVPLSGTAPGGTHSLLDEGIAVIGAGSGTQDIVVDLQSGLTSSPHVLVGVGGPSGQLGKSDGIVSANSTSNGGGLFDLRNADSTMTTQPNVSITIGSAKMRGKDIFISSASASNGAISSRGEGGGFLSFGSSSATGTISNTVKTTLGSGSDLFATRDIKILSNGTQYGNTESVNATGGLIGTASATATLQVGFDIETKILGKVIANRTLVADAADGVDLNAYSQADSAGLGADVDANDDSSKGLHINNGLAQTEIGNGADLRAATVYLSAGVGELRGINASNGQVTSAAMTEKALARSNAHAAALGADSDAASHIIASDATKVLLDGGSSITGDFVQLKSIHNNVNFQADSSASCSCGGGDTDATAEVTYNRDSFINGAVNAVVRTADLNVFAEEYWSTLYTHAHSDGGLFDGGSADAPLNNNPSRTIVWNATTYLLGEPNPVLIIDSTGTIIAKTYNVTARRSSDNAALSIGDIVPGGDTINIDPIIYDELPSALFFANQVDGSHLGTISGKSAIFYMQETWDSVTIANSSDRPIHLFGTGGSPNQSINVLNASLTTSPEAVISVSVDSGAEHAPSPTVWEFNVKHVFPATITSIQSLSGAASMTACASGPCNLTIDGNIANVIGTTTLKNDRGNIFVGSNAYFTSNQLFIDSDLGSAGTLASPVKAILVQWDCTGAFLCSAPHPKPVVLQAEVGNDLFLDLTTIRRDSESAAVSTPITPLIGPIFAGHDIWINVNNSAEGINKVAPGQINVDRYTPNAVPGSGSTVQQTATWRHFFPDSGTTADVVGGPLILVAYGSDLTNINANYQFCGNAACTARGVTAGHNIDIHHASTAASITFRVLSDVDATFTDADRGTLTFSNTDNSGRIDLKTNGSIVDTETTGSLRVGQIWSTGSCTSSPPCNSASAPAWLTNALGDVTLNSPSAILDAELDAGALGTDPTSTDVIGRNITMTAGNNGIGAVSGKGGVGTPNDFLETNVDADGGALGVLTVTDTDAVRKTWNINSIPSNLPPGTGTYGVFITETPGDMKVNRILTSGDVSLVTLSGSIVDARSGGAGDNTPLGVANVVANNIDLDANGGSIGAAQTNPDALGNDLKVDSSNLVTGRLGAEADQSIFLTETVGALNVLLAQALGTGNNAPCPCGNGVRLTVRESAIQGEDLNLIHPSDTINADQNEAAILVVENTKRDIVVTNPSTNSPSINALNGWILLRAGDNVNLGATLPFAATDAARIANNTKVLAGKWIDIFGDFNNLDPGFGSVMHLNGTITPGVLSPACIAEINPGRDCNITRVFGNVDTDTINFDQTYLGGRTRVYGSNTPTPTGATAPLGDSEDFFFVNQIQTMNVNAGHTLTLDGQAATDSYVINTTGSQPCFNGDITGSTCHNYVINVLDTGAPNDGVDVLIVNGFDSSQSGYSDPTAGVSYPTDDIFLLRRSNFIASTPTSNAANETADDPAFVALLHGNLGLSTTAFTGNITAFNTTITCTSCTIGTNDFLHNGFLAGQRIHISGAGVFSGDYTVTAVTQTTMTVAEIMPSGVSLTTEQVPMSPVALSAVKIGILRNDVTIADPAGDATKRTQSYERINYDTAINGRLIVNGLGGNDYFASDDNSTTTTLDGGLGNDNFQIGQIFGLSRDTLNSPTVGSSCTPQVSADGLERDTSCGSLNPQDIFATVATTRGWLSAGNTQPLVAVGDKGDDIFTVYSDHAALRLEGGDDNDLFVVRAFALAQTKLNGGDPTAADCTPDPSNPACDIVWINANDYIAMPKLTSGFSTAAESDIRTGSGQNQVEYNMNAPVSIDGGNGFDKVVILGTEYADHIVVTSKAIYGAGLSVTYTNIEVLEIDALE
ncbi:MAG: hypothetical protein ABR507_02275, partial [Actinomycetota bacterium]